MDSEGKEEWGPNPGQVNDMVVRNDSKVSLTHGDVVD